MKQEPEDKIWRTLYWVGSTFEGMLTAMTVAFLLAILLMSIASLHN